MKIQTFTFAIRTILPNVLLAALVSVACAADNSVQIKVKDTRGKPAAGAELWLEKAGVKGAKKTVTDASGQFTFKNLGPGQYKISAYDYNTPAAAATTFEPSAKGVTSVALSLDRISHGAMTAKTKKRYVWVSGGETGSHIGGGKWVPVDENSNGTGASSMDKRSGQTLSSMQGAQDLRAWQGPSN
ncbi:MAG TPA: carboxypeptidase-like regulatory domain-containing protein [Chthoniobacterales bacterium]|nr:carboxypeptidase-like regulatory domain-containing protein [Chthoniobacterales bacterium]